MSVIPNEDGTYPEPRRALSSQDTLLRYKKATRVLPEKKEVSSHYAHTKGKSQLPPKDVPKTTKEILNIIFPPRHYEEGGKKFTQEVECEPAYGWEVKDLNRRLKDRLKENNAEEVYVGLCPVRKWLYDQCFDELLRQVAVNMGERGLLLKRIRDDLRMTLDSYHKLYVSATRYAVCKAITVAKRQFDAEKNLAKLTLLRETLEREIAELKADQEREEKTEAEISETTDKEHATECFLLRRKCRTLEAQVRTKVIAIALKKKNKKKPVVKKYKYKLFKT